MKGIYSCKFKTTLGSLSLAATSQGLYSLEFRRAKSSNDKIPARVNALLKRAARQIRRYLSGKQLDFPGLPIDWTGYRPFEKKVLRGLRRIPAGKTATYQFLAKRAGRPKATRYVGRILHVNRLPIVIPCHRILPKKGGLGGFSQGTGVKRHLLKLEHSRADKK